MTGKHMTREEAQPLKDHIGERRNAPALRWFELRFVSSDGHPGESILRKETVFGMMLQELIVYSSDKGIDESTLCIVACDRVCIGTGGFGK